MSLLSKNLETLNAASGYKFSATKMTDLGSAQYTLATLVLDTSGSVKDFKVPLEQMLKNVFLSMKSSPRVDSLMYRVVTFADSVKEVHGFKLLNTIGDTDYDGILKIGGMTALYDAMDEAIQASSTYGKQLIDQDFSANAIVVVVTDGENNRGAIQNPAIIKRSVDAARKIESLESIIIILVGVNTNQDDDTSNLSTYLLEVKNESGVDQYVNIGKASPKRIAKLAEFISQSVSSSSSALASGTPSTPINPSQFNF